MKFWIRLLCLVLGFTLQAQNIVVNGQEYQVKGETILEDKIDVTEKLSLEERESIFKTIESKIEKEKQEAGKKVEKELEKAKKEQKKAEKELKSREKAQSKFDKADKKHKQAFEKYEKLKKKGKLSPQDEKKWLSKIEKLKVNHEKARQKLK